MFPPLGQGPVQFFQVYCFYQAVIGNDVHGGLFSALDCCVSEDF